MVLVEPLERRLSKGIAGVHCRLELDHLARLNGIDSRSLLGLRSVTRLARCSKAQTAAPRDSRGLYPRLYPRLALAVTGFQCMPPDIIRPVLQ